MSAGRTLPLLCILGVLFQMKQCSGIFVAVCRSLGDQLRRNAIQDLLNSGNYFSTRGG